MSTEARELNVLCVDCPNKCKQYATAFIEYCPKIRDNPKLKNTQPELAIKKKGG